MASHPRAGGPRADRRSRRLRPWPLRLEERAVPSLNGINGIAFDTANTSNPAADIFISYDSTTGLSGQQQSIALVTFQGNEINPSVFSTTGASAIPGALATVGASASLPSVSTNDVLELQPNGQLFVYDPVGGTSSQYDNLPKYTANMSNVFDVQTGSSVNLSSQISLAGATYGDFGVYGSSLVVSAVSNNWDFVMRLTYGSSGGVATVLAASPISNGLSTSPGGVAVDSTGMVLSTMPYVPAGSATAIDAPVGFNLFYDTGSKPTPFVSNLDLASVPNIDSGGITVDSQNNFLLAVQNSSLFGAGAGPGIVHINAALSAYLAVPESGEIPTGIAFQSAAGTNALAFTDAASGLFTPGTELPLFSGQASPAQLLRAYGINQISFTSPSGKTVAGDGSGQTIAIIEQGIDPTLGADLTTFDKFFGIPAPPSFSVMDQTGATTNLDTVAEASLDVEWAHAVAPGASILVYDAGPTAADLMEAMQQASTQGVSVVTLSYGLPESELTAAQEQLFDSYFTTPGVTFLAASGDTGIYGGGGFQPTVDYPAASPNVVAVGGTSIVIDSSGDYPGTGTSGEVGWNDSGGGLSALETEPAWQSGVVSTSIDPYGARAVPDVAMDSGSAQEYDVFTSTLSANSSTINTASGEAVGWLGDAGTSAASPIWAGLIAIADQGRALAGGAPLTGYTQTLPALYALPAGDFHDIVSGNNGVQAGPGYDLVTGRGSPIANLLVPALAGYEIPNRMAIKSEPQSNVIVGNTVNLTVQVEDSLGNPVTGSTVTVALGMSPSGAILGGNRTAAVVDGLATFSNLTLSQPGSYTLTVTDNDIGGALSTSSINVTAGSIATKVGVTASTTTPVVGQKVTLSATVSVVSPATGVPTGTVTFEEGSTILGSATLIDGAAQFSTTPSAAGAETITLLYGGDANDQPATNQISLTVGQGTATLGLSNLNVTYDGAPQAAVVTTSPGGLAGVTITYTQDGVTVTNPTRVGDYTVNATLDNPNYTAAPVTGTLVIGQATPVVTWATPGNITVGTALGAVQLDATASFDGVPVLGVSTYSPPLGTMLLVGNGQTLMVTFVPTDSTDYKTVTSRVLINVVPQSTPPPPTAMVIGEQPVFRRKLNKKGIPVGKAVLSGFKLKFDMPLSATAASNPENYVLDTVTLKKVKKSLVRVLHPVKGFTVTYTSASDSVTLNLAGTQTFPTGGQITVLSGVTDNSGDLLAGHTVFTIAAGGKKITAP
jgi:hypothetical protein